MIYAELLLAMAALMFSGTLFLPVDTLNAVPYHSMALVAPEIDWAIAALLIGLFQLYGCITLSRIIKIKAAIASSSFWVVVTAFIFLGSQSSLVFVAYFNLTLVSFLWFHWLWEGRDLL